MTQLRIAYFITDHFLGSQLPLGIVFDGPDGRLVVANPRTPDQRCIGGAAALFTWNRARALLAQHTGDELPLGVGPHVTLSAPIELPAGARYDTYANGLFAEVVDKPAERGTRGATRISAGMRFLSNWNVAGHVKTKFKADQRLPSAKHLAPISHYVDGHRTTLLLEPLAFDRQGLTRTVTDVATRLGAYAHALEVDGVRGLFKLQVYALEGGRQEERREAFDALTPFAQVVDISVPKARDSFLEEIRASGELGQARLAVASH
jgi:hypothetical protein